jgi:tetratricopeptide (TPR) repeat protein
MVFRQRELDVTTSQNDSGSDKLPSLPALFRQYLRKQATAHAAGFAEVGPAEVVPFEAVPLQPVDPKVAWSAALEAAKFYGFAGATSVKDIPPTWPQLVAQCEPELALPFCLGNYPQMVRDLAPFVAPTKLNRLRPARGRPRPSANLDALSSKQADDPLQHLLTVALLRLMKDFDRAADHLDEHRDRIPAGYEAAWANEEAALAWHSGRVEEARAAWESQSDITPVLFNRGMAALFADRPAEARSSLTNAISQMSDESPWYHLGSFYIAAAEILG